MINSVNLAWLHRPTIYLTDLIFLDLSTLPKRLKLPYNQATFEKKRDVRRYVSTYKRSDPNDILLFSLVYCIASLWYGRALLGITWAHPSLALLDRQRIRPVKCGTCSSCSCNHYCLCTDDPPSTYYHVGKSIFAVTSLLKTVKISTCVGTFRYLVPN